MGVGGERIVCAISTESSAAEKFDLAFDAAIRVSPDDGCCAFAGERAPTAAITQISSALA